MHLGVDKRGKNVYHLCVDFLGFYRCVMKICKNCGEINLNDSEYCCNCGKNSFVFSEEVTCPVCGAANDKSYTHCTNCGSALSNHGVLPAVGNVTPEEVNSVRAELQTVYEQSLNVHAKEQLVCPNCGSSVNINSIYCDKCGTPVYRLNDHRVVKRKICPHCGRPNPAHISLLQLLLCVPCGQRFGRLSAYSRKQTGGQCGCTAGISAIARRQKQDMQQLRNAQQTRRRLLRQLRS